MGQREKLSCHVKPATGSANLPWRHRSQHGPTELLPLDAGPLHSPLNWSLDVVHPGKWHDLGKGISAAQADLGSPGEGWL